jgi:hypothetical protein
MPNTNPAMTESPQPTVERGCSGTTGAKSTGASVPAQKRSPSEPRLNAALSAPRLSSWRTAVTASERRTDRLPKKLSGFLPIWLHKVRFFAERQPQRLAARVQECLQPNPRALATRPAYSFHGVPRGGRPEKNDEPIFGALREEIPAPALEILPFGRPGRRTWLKNFRNRAVVFHDFQIRARRLMCRGSSDPNS